MSVRSTPTAARSDAKTADVLPLPPPAVASGKTNGTKQAKRPRFKQSDRILLAKRQNWRCKLCDESIKSGFDADHILSIKLGGANHIDNGQALCIPCHADKTRTDRQTFEFRELFATVSGNIASAVENRFNQRQQVESTLKTQNIMLRRQAKIVEAIRHRLPATASVQFFAADVFIRLKQAAVKISGFDMKDIEAAQHSATDNDRPQWTLLLWLICQTRASHDVSALISSLPLALDAEGLPKTDETSSVSSAEVIDANLTFAKLETMSPDMYPTVRQARYEAERRRRLIMETIRRPQPPAVVGPDPAVESRAPKRRGDADSKEIRKLGGDGSFGSDETISKRRRGSDRPTSVWPVWPTPSNLDRFINASENVANTGFNALADSTINVRTAPLPLTIPTSDGLLDGAVSSASDENAAFVIQPNSEPASFTDISANSANW